jgi:hypothetical protein
MEMRVFTLFCAAVVPHMVSYFCGSVNNLSSYRLMIRACGCHLPRKGHAGTAAWIPKIRRFLPKEERFPIRLHRKSDEGVIALPGIGITILFLVDDMASARQIR